MYDTIKLTIGAARHLIMSGWEQLGQLIRYGHARTWTKGHRGAAPRSRGSSVRGGGKKILSWSDKERPLE